jgi:hypothetical protein
MRERIFSVEGVRQMQDALDGWSPEQMVAWLHDGFACIADPARHAEWQDAFPPLRFHPGSDARAQFAAALREAHRAEHAWPGKLRRAAEGRLRAPREEEAAVAGLADLWSCIEATGFATGDIPLARLVVSLVEERQTAEPVAARDLLLRIANAAAAAPPSGPQQQFFATRLLGSPAWDEGMLLSYLYARLRDDATPADRQQLLLELDGWLRTPLRRAVNSGTLSGRLLVGALRDWLHGAPGDESLPPLDSAAARSGLRRIEDMAKRAGGEDEPISVRITRSRTFAETSALGRLMAA